MALYVEVCSSVRAFNVQMFSLRCKLHAPLQGVEFENSVRFGVSHPAWATRCSDKCEIWRGRAFVRGRQYKLSCVNVFPESIGTYGLTTVIWEIMHSFSSKRYQDTTCRSQRSSRQTCRIVDIEVGHFEIS